MRPAVAIVGFLLAAVAVFPPARASEQDAAAISNNIQSLHLPHGAILDPVFASPDSTRVVHYTRGGDSAIWTGHYLAAEVFRYRVTRSPEALANAWRALKGIRALVNVTRSNILARCAVPVDWEQNVDRRAIITEEAGHGVHTSAPRGTPYYWIGNTSRDQYCGVFFGLVSAYDMVSEADDPKVRPFVKKLVTRLLTNLLDNDWAIRMPDGRISALFTGRFDQQLSFLQVGRRVNPDAFDAIYRDYRERFSSLVAAPIGVDCLDPHESYFKFNIDYITLYNLIRLEDSQEYRERYLFAYAILRRTTESHGNAHFNAIDRALRGADVVRDAQTADLLEAWLERPRRDEYVDWTCCYALCGENRSCEPIPVSERVRTDFLWQRSPFQLAGGGAGTIETAGIDYILPFWMIRHIEATTRQPLTTGH